MKIRPVIAMSLLGTMACSVPTSIDGYTIYERKENGAIHVGFISTAAALFVGMQACEEAKPTDRVYDTVTVNASDMTYDIAFACTRQDREKDLCRKIENLESVFINKRDSWSVSYSTKPREYEHPLLSQLQEQAWRMAQAEHYLRMYAEEDQQ